MNDTFDPLAMSPKTKTQIKRSFDGRLFRLARFVRQAKGNDPEYLCRRMIGNVLAIASAVGMTRGRILKIIAEENKNRWQFDKPDAWLKDTGFSRIND